MPCYLRGPSGLWRPERTNGTGMTVRRGNLHPRSLVPAHIYVYIHVYMPRRRLPTSLDEISSHCVCFSVRRAARAVTQAYDRTLAPSGLRATQLTLLVALARAGTVPFARLASALGMDRTTFTRNVAPLKRDGLLTMRRGPDRRVKLVAITTSGRRALARAIPLWERAQRRITVGVGAERWDSLRRDIERITALADINPREGTRP